MARIETKSTYNVMDMWQKYVKDMLAANPEYWSRYENYTSNFAVYCKDGNRVKEVMNYKRFNAIIRSYFTRAKKAIIKGEAVNMMASVGKICARRVQRDFRKPKQNRINWHRTKQQPLVFDDKEQRMKYEHKIYHVEDEWCRIGWHKTKTLANESVYEFKPTAQSSTKQWGFAMEFSNALRADPLLKYQYLYFPVGQIKKQEQ